MKGPLASGLTLDGRNVKDTDFVQKDKTQAIWQLLVEYAMFVYMDKESRARTLHIHLSATEYFHQTIRGVELHNIAHPTWIIKLRGMGRDNNAGNNVKKSRARRPTIILFFYIVFLDDEESLLLPPSHRGCGG